MTPGRAHEGRATRRSAGRLAVALALALATGAGGCSFQWMRTAPRRADWPDPVVPSSSQQRCSDVIGLPIADTVVSVTMGTIGFLERNSVTGTLMLKPPAERITIAAQNTLSNERLTGKGLAPSQYDVVATPDHVSRSIAVGLDITALLFLASAVYGYVQTGRCRHYKSIFQSPP
jgi:hypothetical protein